jgi:glycosyltransferase involved in cell wall biosynthesis
MKKVIFFTQNRWAFGTIHHGLCKELYKNGIYANLLDYDIDYSHDEFNLLIDSYDYFVTQPDSIPRLLEYNTPLEKIVAVAHAEWDINLSNFHEIDKRTNNYNIHSYGVISNKLLNIVNAMNYSIKPKLVTNGIHFDMFYNKPSNQLNTVGYGGTMFGHNFSGQEIKRGLLVQQAAEMTNLRFFPSATYNHLAMAGYYKQVDSIIMSSIEEACGLPMLEAAAAGKLCIGTPVGYFAENGLKGGGIQVPIDQELFVSDAVILLDYYKNNQEEYYKKCLDIQEYARYNYDWSKVIDQWIELF